MGGKDVVQEKVQEKTENAVLRMFPKARQLRERLRGVEARSRRLQTRVSELEDRVRSLEEEVTEARRLNKRIAELTDLVGEVLLPASSRDDEDVHQRLQAFVERR